jgi:hypothetical protein
MPPVIVPGRVPGEAPTAAITLVTLLTHRRESRRAAVSTRI